MKTTLKDLSNMMEFCRTIAFRPDFGLSIVPANAFIIVKHIKEYKEAEVVSSNATETFDAIAAELDCTTDQLTKWLDEHADNGFGLFDDKEGAPGGVIIYANVLKEDFTPFDLIEEPAAE